MTLYLLSRDKQDCPDSLGNPFDVAEAGTHTTPRLPATFDVLE